MSFKELLVHLDGSPQSAATAALAVSLASRHQAHLTGLYVLAREHYQPEHGSADAECAAVRAELLDRAAEAGVSAEFTVADPGVSGVAAAELVIRHAYHADLVVLGQPEPDARKGGAELPERVARGAGAPVLVVPRCGSFGVLERPMVAWRNGRESARALKDALPFLKMAQEVRVLEVTTPGEPEYRPTGAEVCRLLERHGVSAQAEVLPAEIAVGDMLINEAWEQRCDLLIMGAYATTSRGTVHLGAVARHVLGHMPVPVLISH